MSITSEGATPQKALPRVALPRWLDRFLSGNATTDGGVARLEQQLRDFANGGIALYWRRQGMYLASALMCGYYYSVPVALICYFFCQLTEFWDTQVSRKVAAWKGGNLAQARKFHRQLLLTSTLSSIAVSLFVYLVAYMEGVSSHFTPLFFLFAAGLFAAVNNHQIPQILSVRLMLYGLVFAYIPAHDIWVVRPDLKSELWLHFLTAMFVLYFVIDCSFIFLRLYQKGLDQLDELRLQRDAAQEAYKVKSEFVSIVSHELRTPLTSINGALGLMRSGAFNSDPDRFDSILQIAHKNSVRLSMLINDLLDVQKLEHGQLSYKFALTDLAQIIDEAVDSISTYASPHNITVKFFNSGEKIMAKVDHDRLLQVLDNLLSNAVKFSKVGGVVEIYLTTNGDHARISVKDYGIGIPENSREKVFGRFSQIDSSDKRSHGGSGLGLSIAQDIVKAHGGSIDYSSQLGEGTTFIVDLPSKR